MTWRLHGIVSPVAPEELNDIDTQLLEDTLRYIVTTGYYSRLELLGGAVLTSLSGDVLFVDQRGFTFFANGQEVVEADRLPQNGVVHEMNVMLNAPAVCDAQAPCDDGFECDDGRMYAVAALGTCANPLSMNVGSSGANTSAVAGALP